MPGSTPVNTLPPGATVLLASGSLTGAFVLGADSFNVTSSVKTSLGNATITFTNAITGTYWVRITYFVHGGNPKMLVQVRAAGSMQITNVNSALAAADIVAGEKVWFEVFQ